MAQLIEFPTGAERSGRILGEKRMNRAQLFATRLRQLREARSFTQEGLALESGVSERTLSRLENGESSPRKVTGERLAKALRVDPAILTGEKPIPPDLAHTGASVEEAAYQLNVRVRPAVRNAYELAARQYKVSVTKIAQLAPLLFVIVAEASLSHRRAKLSECQTKMDELREAVDKLPRGNVPMEDDDIWWEEEESLSKNEVFGPNAADSDNPFATYLEALAARYAGDDVSIDAVAPNWTGYRVCRSAALALAEGDEALRDSLLTGEALIHQIPRGLTSEQRIAWMLEHKTMAREFEEEPSEETPEELPMLDIPILDLDIQF